MVKTSLDVDSGYYIKGTAKNGMKLEGWVDVATGELKSFYPVFDWSKK